MATPDALEHKIYVAGRGEGKVVRKVWWLWKGVYRTEFEHRPTNEGWVLSLLTAALPVAC